MRTKILTGSAKMEGWFKIPFEQTSRILKYLLIEFDQNLSQFRHKNLTDKQTFDLKYWYGLISHANHFLI